MELGEPVNIVMEDQKDDPDCPFVHEVPKDDLENELGGIGTKLGTNLANGKGVHTKKPPIGGDFTKGPEIADPRDRPDGFNSVYVTVNEHTISLNNDRLKYPLTCAAHHLIPAQESLKGSPVLKFMCKEGQKQDFRNGAKPAPATVSGALVWGNVGYNVNGGQNGVWLPGNYAVGAGPGGIEVWKNHAKDKRKTISDAQAAENWEKALDYGGDEWKLQSADPIENEGPQPGALAAAISSSVQAQFMLAGTNYNIDKGNPKWAYVKAAMDVAGGQFHDRHGDYSGEVKKYLIKIAASYQRMYDKAKNKDKKKACAECEKTRKAAGAKDNLVGPPYGIVGRLVTGSNFFNGFVGVATVTARNIYTTKWVDAWIKKEKPAKSK